MNSTEVQKKKLRNKLYYERNKAKILASRGSGSKVVRKSLKSQPHTLGRQKILGSVGNVTFIFPKLKKSAQKLKSKVAFNLEHAFLIALIAFTTLFLIHETALYLNQTEGGSTGLIKAALGEGLVVALSWQRFASTRLKIARVGLLLAFFAFNLWTLTGTVIASSETSLTRTQILERTIQELEHTIESKEILRVKTWEQGKETLSRKYERQIDDLRHELNSVRTERLKFQSPMVERLNTFQSILFRLIVMSANALLVSQLSRLKRRDYAIAGVLQAVA